MRTSLCKHPLKLWIPGGSGFVGKALSAKIEAIKTGREVDIADLEAVPLHRLDEVQVLAAPDSAQHDVPNLGFGAKRDGRHTTELARPDTGQH